MNGHSAVVEVICQWLQGVEDLYTVNKKQHTAAHVASNASVLKALYENGANLWITDAKGRSSLFTASFFGRAECVAFLLDVATTSSSSLTAVTGSKSRLV
jgi:ankyrin repeat protein